MQSSSRLSKVNFYGSIMGCCSRTLPVYSFLGDNLKFLVFDEDMMISVSCSSWVDGNSQRNSFLQFLVAVASFLELSIGNASRFGSSLVQNLRLYSLPPLPRPALTGYCSQKYPKNEVFQGEQCNLSDSAFLQAWVGSELSRGRLSRTEGVCLVGCSLFWKKSLGSLLLLILMRLGLPLGSLNLCELSATLVMRSLPDSNSEICLRRMRFSRTMSQRQSILLIIILFAEQLNTLSSNLDMRAREEWQGTCFKEFGEFEGENGERQSN